jgi:hypothetical protein
VFTGINRLVGDEALIAHLAAHCLGLDGRRIRKLLLSAMGSSPELALDPGLLTPAHLRAAVEAERAGLAAASHA